MLTITRSEFDDAKDPVNVRPDPPFKLGIALRLIQNKDGKLLGAERGKGFN